MKTVNFNEYKTKTNDFSLDTGSTCVFFRDLESRLIEVIRSADLVVGCVAWLTSERVLAALSHVPGGVGIVVQKEAYVRPGGKLHSLYCRLPPPRPVYFDGVVRDLNTKTFEPVRCIGEYHDKKKHYPRMHHKFLVFCRVTQFNIQPFKVWTGSFNFTNNATRSFENAIVFHNWKIAQAYYQEWSQLMALSEPLSWESNHMTPQWSVIN